MYPYVVYLTLSHYNPIELGLFTNKKTGEDPPWWDCLKIGRKLRTMFDHVFCEQTRLIGCVVSSEIHMFSARESKKLLAKTSSGWWFQPLWKIWKSNGSIIPNIFFLSGLREGFALPIGLHPCAAKYWSCRVTVEHVRIMNQKDELLELYIYIHSIYLCASDRTFFSSIWRTRILFLQNDRSSDWRTSSCCTKWQQSLLRTYGLTSPDSSPITPFNPTRSTPRKMMKDVSLNNTHTHAHTHIFIYIHKTS